MPLCQIEGVVHGLGIGEPGPPSPVDIPDTLAVLDVAALDLLNKGVGAGCIAVNFSRIDLPCMGLKEGAPFNCPVRRL